MRADARARLVLRVVFDVWCLVNHAETAQNRLTVVTHLGA